MEIRLPKRVEMDVTVAVTLGIAQRISSAHGQEISRRQREAWPLALALVAESDAEARRRIRRSRGRLHSPHLVQALIRLSGEAASSDSVEGLRIADLAERLLERIPPRTRQRYRGCYWLDLQAGLWSERGNALRLQQRWREARQAFGRAVVLLEAGSGDALLTARVAYLMASNFWDRGRVRAALFALELASNLYTEIGDEARLGEVQLKHAAFLASHGRLAEAIDLQVTALAHLEEEAEPITALAAYANLASMMQRAGRDRSALSVLEASEHLVEGLPECHAVGVWWWISGRCRMSKGTSDGEEDLKRAWRILEKSRAWPDLGMVGLDLAQVYLGCGRFEDLQQIAGPAVEALSRQKLTGEEAEMVMAFRDQALSVAARSEGLRRLVENLVQRLGRGARQASWRETP